MKSKLEKIEICRNQEYCYIDIPDNIEINLSDNAETIEKKLKDQLSHSIFNNESSIIQHKFNIDNYYNVRISLLKEYVLSNDRIIILEIDKEDIDSNIYFYYNNEKIKIQDFLNLSKILYNKINPDVLVGIAVEYRVRYFDNVDINIDVLANGNIHFYIHIKKENN